MSFLGKAMEMVMGALTGKKEDDDKEEEVKKVEKDEEMAEVVEVKNIAAEVAGRKRKRDEDAVHVEVEEFKKMWVSGGATGPVVTSSFVRETLGEDRLSDAVMEDVMKGVNADIKAHIPLDLEWHAPLEDEEDPDTVSTVLKITGMPTPFSRLLFRKFLEKPASYQQTLTDEAFVVLDDAVYVDYDDKQIARRQKRRISGSTWPAANGCTITAKFVSKEKVAQAQTDHKEKANQEETRLRHAVEAAMKKAQEEANPPKLTLDDLFSKTETKPKLYYKLNEDAQVIQKAREQAQRDLAKLLA